MEYKSARFRVSSDIDKSLNILSALTDKTKQELAEEALTALLKKYGGVLDDKGLQQVRTRETDK